MFVMGYFSSNRPTRQLLQHDVDINQRVTTSIHEHNGCLDVPCRISSDLGELIAGTKCQVRLYVVVIHLKRFIANDLEPMDDGLGAGERV